MRTRIIITLLLCALYITGAWAISAQEGAERTQVVVDNMRDGGTEGYRNSQMAARADVRGLLVAAYFIVLGVIWFSPLKKSFMETFMERTKS